MTTARYVGSAVPSSPTGGTEPEGAVTVDEQAASDGQVSRRQLVRGAAIVGTVAAAGIGLAACSSATPKAAGPATGAAVGTAPAATSAAGTGTAAATTSAAPPASGSGSGGGAETSPESFPNFALGKASSIPVGGGVIYAKHGVVVTQPTKGVFKVFSSSCTHLGCTVNKVADGLILCPCHGAKFSIVDGSVKGGPAPRPLTVQEFSIENGVVALD
ncbi:MAG TPA: Rieske 2Fe-2S domain-containing protein [Pseudonocardiaceae bacterium]|nr:Rieske 2Fe-2S domain-containing protein [Pseudonocardiaceae bacterium]